MADNDFGLSSSHSRINLTPKTSNPPSSKVISNSANGVKMDPRSRNKPDGWAAGLSDGKTANPMRSEDFAKKGQFMTKPKLEFGVKGPKPESC